MHDFLIELIKNINGIATFTFMATVTASLLFAFIKLMETSVLSFHSLLLKIIFISGLLVLIIPSNDYLDSLKQTKQQETLCQD